MIIEKDAWTFNGYIASVVAILFFLCGIYSAMHSEIFFSIIFFISALIIATGLTYNEAGYAKVIFFTGKYVGVIRGEGLMMTVPFAKKKSISLKIFTNHRQTTITTEVRKETVSISIIYKIVDSAKAMIVIDDIAAYIDAQTEIYYCQYLQMIETEAFLSENKEALQSKLDIAGIQLIDIAFSICPSA